MGQARDGGPAGGGREPRRSASAALAASDADQLVARIARRFRVDTDDLAQKTFLKLAAPPDTVDLALVWTVASHLALDELRRTKRESAALARLREETARVGPPPAESAMPDPPSRTDDRYDRLVLVLERLPAEMRDAIRSSWGLSSGVEDHPPPEPATEGTPMRATGREKARCALQMLRRAVIASEIVADRTIVLRAALRAEVVAVAEAFSACPRPRRALRTAAPELSRLAPAGRQDVVSELFQMIHTVMFWERLGMQATCLAAYRVAIDQLDASRGLPGHHDPERLARVRRALTCCGIDETFSEAMYRVYHYLVLGDVGQKDANRRFSDALEPHVRVNVYSHIRNKHLPVLDILERHLSVL